MEQKQKKWLIIAIIIVILLLIIILGSKKEPAMFEEDYLPEDFDRESLEDMEAAPELKVEKIVEPEAVAPEASPVTEEGIVITEEGTPVVTEDVGPGSEGAPKQSKILEEEEKEQVLENAISLEVSRETGFVPSSFKVKPGQVVTILLTVTDTQKHILRFKDKSLRAVAITVKDGQSRATTFNAPTQMGVYEFICSDPGHSATGQMIVTEE